MRKKKIILCACILSMSITSFGQDFVLLNSRGSLSDRIAVVILIGICIFVFKVLLNVFFRIGKINENGVLFNKDKTILVSFNSPEENYIIPNGIVSIGISAFYNCDNLISITIPDSVTDIGDYAFEECINLKHIYLQVENPPEISENVFDKVNKNACILYVPIGSRDKYAKANAWEWFKNIQEITSEEFASVKK